MTRVIFSVNSFTNYTSADYNGFRLNPGAVSSFQWNSPPVGVSADFTTPDHNARLETRTFTPLAEYSKATGQDAHSVLVDYDVFMNVRRLDAQDSATVQKLYKASDSDFRLEPGSAAVDRGVALPTITEDSTGRRLISARRGRQTLATLWAASLTNPHEPRRHGDAKAGECTSVNTGLVSNRPCPQGHRSSSVPLIKVVPLRSARALPKHRCEALKHRASRRLAGGKPAWF